MLCVFFAVEVHDLISSSLRNVILYLNLLLSGTIHDIRRLFRRLQELSTDGDMPGSNHRSSQRDACHCVSDARLMPPMLAAPLWRQENGKVAWTGREEEPQVFY